MKNIYYAYLNNIIYLLLGIGLITYIFYCYLPIPYGVDTYYHLRYSQLIYEDTHSPFVWLPYTIYHTNYLDHHYGFHILLSYFSTSKNILSNANIWLCFQTIIVSLLIVISFALIMDKYYGYWQIPVLLMFWGMSSYLTARLLMVRAHSIGIGLMLLSIALMVKKKYYSLAMTSFLFAWYFNLMWLTVVLHLIMYVVFMKSSLNDKFKCSLATLGGGSIGWLFHPEFPETIKHTIFYLFQKSLFPIDIDVGGEWYPMPLNLYMHQIIYTLLFLYLFVFYEMNHFKNDKNIYFYCALIIYYFIMSLYSSRHISLYLPIIFLIGSQKLILNIFDVKTFTKKIFGYHMIALVIFLLTIIELINQGNAFINMNTITKESMNWLKNNSKQNEIILNYNWSEFPALFCENQYNSYAWGLDPKYLYYQNQELYFKIMQLRYGIIDASSVLNSFKSSYLIIGNYNHEMISQLDQDETVQLVYYDVYFSIYSNYNVISPKMNLYKNGVDSSALE